MIGGQEAQRFVGRFWQGASPRQKRPLPGSRVLPFGGEAREGRPIYSSSFYHS